MRNAMAAVLTAFVVCADAAAQTPTKAQDNKAMEAFEAANVQRNVCLAKLIKQLSVSKDPIEHVASAVLLECDEPIRKWKLAARSAFPNVPFGGIVKTLDDQQRKTVIAALVLMRVSATA